MTAIRTCHAQFSLIWDGSAWAFGIAPTSAGKARSSSPLRFSAWPASTRCGPSSRCHPRIRTHQIATREAIHGSAGPASELSVSDGHGTEPHRCLMWPASEIRSQVPSPMSASLARQRWGFLFKQNPRGRHGKPTGGKMSQSKPLEAQGPFPR